MNLFSPGSHSNNKASNNITLFLYFGGTQNFKVTVCIFLLSRLSAMMDDPKNELGGRQDWSV